MQNKTKLIRNQLDPKLKRLHPLMEVLPPNKGWIRALRSALGMSSRQLGRRLNVSQQRIISIEQDELEGNLTLKLLKRIAKATNTVFVYGFIPKEDLESIVRQQARLYIKHKQEQTKHSMALEDQTPTSKNYQQLLELEADEILYRRPSKIWDAPS